MTPAVGPMDRNLPPEEVEAMILRSLDALALKGKRVLIIIPDGTRTMPLPLFFRTLVRGLRGAGARRITFLIALGTHPPMSLEAQYRLIGITHEEKAQDFADVRLLNHRWHDPAALSLLGEIGADKIEALSQGRLHETLPVRVNRELLRNDHLILCGPVFPHEVVGFSGGNKYLFPGVSGPEVIDLTHWLGALLTSYHIIGTMDTPVRAIIDCAAAMIPTECSALCCVIGHDEGVAGLFFGEARQAWAQAAQLSAQVHILWKERAFQRALSVMPEQYEDLWTGAKGMYKVEPVMADGGEVILYAPHIRQLSVTHADTIQKIGYHVLDFFVKQWDRHSHFPRAVLAHSTHVRGIGSFEHGIEKPRIQVTLATQIPCHVCRAVGLGFIDPSDINLEAWSDREAQGILLVRKAGESLYRLKG